MQNKKIIIVHDTFLYKGGGERFIIMLANTLGADICSAFFSQGSFDLKKEGFTGKAISIGSETFTRGLRHIQLKWVFAYRTKFLRDYDIVIFSGDSLDAVRNVSPNAQSWYYCHTPPRYLYDLKDMYLAKVPLFLRPLFLLVSLFFRFLYEKNISKIDKIYTNSNNTKKRIQKYLGLHSQVIYPPVDANRFHYSEPGDYYLSFARLSSAKRVDQIVDAFIALPGKKLKIVYGNNDPQKNVIFDKIKGYKNIECVTFPGNIGFYECVSKSIATIYIPIHEDFGMSVIESMAAGKPVIGVDEGGIPETLIDGTTGILLAPDFSISDLCDAIISLTPEKAISMRLDCEEQAKKFAFENFQKQIYDVCN